MRVLGRKILMVGIAAAASVAMAAPAMAAADTTPPTVPQNLHESLRAAANPVISWDASTDTGTGVSYYWVIVDGQQRAKPKTTSYDIQTLVNLGRITAGQHAITVQAVDFAANRSAPSAPITIIVVAN